ncbi:hypothetical protein AB6A40_010576 [Gnathostoma spinigerum]|uniref:Uncharacterized protein n=1 Tax=Gnathostoma spinigerum TaxID=75299 RepID=A0ABD6F2P7_9BILA
MINHVIIDNVGVFEWRECKRQFGDLHEQINILCDLEGRGREELNSVNDSNDKLGSSSAVSPVIVPIEKEVIIIIIHINVILISDAYNGGAGEASSLS